jgi:Ca-activated chloride channel family protein
MPYRALTERIGEELSRLAGQGTSGLTFGQRDLTITILMALAGISAGLLILGRALRRSPGRDTVAVPALLLRARGSRLGLLRHLPLVLLTAGLPFLAVALADPHVTRAAEEVSYPGRRIALLIDASSSMLAPFPARTLAARAPNEAAFFTTLAAADTFIRQRKGGRYRDLIALIEFGDEAYVVTPFTSDYDNVLLSASLIGDWREFMHFPNQGTAIGTAISRATGLFRAFDFADASGNLMVIFSDGQDTQLTVGQTPVSDILADAVATRIPVYFIRTSRGKLLGDMVPDSIWKPAVETTGGRFYAAASESDVLAAIRDIDRRSPGTIRVTRYRTNEPRFAPFALAAAVCWALAIGLHLAVPLVRTFP